MRGENSGGGRFSARSASPGPPPEERLALGVRFSSEVVPPVSWTRLLVSGVSPRRLTEPPRTCGAGRANPSARSAGTSPFRGGFLRVLRMLHGHGGSVSRRDHNQAYRRPPALAWVRKSEETHKPILSHSSGEGPGEALLLEKRPPPEFSHSLAGRGGSVSRRDHTPKTGKRAQLTWAHKSEGTHKPIPSYSSGEGVWGRGASLREAASPPVCITYITNHTAASWGGRLAVRRVGGASMPVQSSVAAQGARSREARGRETVRGSSERLKSAT